MRFYRWSLPVLLLFTLWPLSAAAQQEPSIEAVVRALEAPFRANTAGKSAIRDFQAEFSQMSHLVSLDRSQSGRGRVLVKFAPTAADQLSGTRFRWNYTEPQPQEIVSDGRTLWVYLPENRQVIESKVDTSADRPDDPMTFLTGLGNLSRDFQVSWASPARTTEGNFLLELVPRRSSPVLQRLVAEVDQQALSARQGKGGSDFPLRSIVVYDPGGNQTRIEFNQVQVNRNLVDSLFHFDPPAGVEVVRPAGRQP